MSNKHTPGPWRIAENSTKITAVHPLRQHAYDIVTIHYAFEHGQYEANARLIAAAPSMYEALRNFIGFAEYHELEKGNPRLQLQLMEMRRAISKATQS